MARRTRIDLQAYLESIAESRNVYFQPPPSIKMNYPAIVYHLAVVRNTHADNSVYKQDTAYQLIVVDRDPDSELAKKVSWIPTAQFDRSYTADNLNHFVYTIFY